jgi:hypothetical protein
VLQSLAEDGPEKDIKAGKGATLGTCPESDLNPRPSRPRFPREIQKAGYRQMDSDYFRNTFFENGGIKMDVLRRNDEGGVGWRASLESRLSDEGDLFLVYFPRNSTTFRHIRTSASS